MNSIHFFFQSFASSTADKQQQKTSRTAFPNGVPGRSLSRVRFTKKLAAKEEKKKTSLKKIKKKEERVFLFSFF
jgi:hypothetical protein